VSVRGRGRRVGAPGPVKGPLAEEGAALLLYVVLHDPSELLLPQPEPVHPDVVLDVLGGRPPVPPPQFEPI